MWPQSALTETRELVEQGSRLPLLGPHCVGTHFPDTTLALSNNLLLVKKGALH